MRLRFFTKFAIFSVLTLALACGGDADTADTNEPNPAEANLGDLGSSSKADDSDPVELTIDANSEREFEFVSDSLGLELSFTQPNSSNPQPNRIFLERQRYGATVIETETSTEHHFTLYPDAGQSRSPDEYKLVVTNEGDQPLQLTMTIQPHQYDPCEQILRGERETVLKTPLARCSSVTYADGDGIYVLKDVDLCIATGRYTSEHPGMLADPNVRDFVEIQGYTDFESSETGDPWASSISETVGVPWNYDEHVTSETEDEISLWSGFGGYIDDGEPAIREETITFDKNSLTFDLERKVKRDGLLSRWRSEWAYTLSCDAYEVADGPETSEAPDGCIDCGAGATCDLITYESRTRLVCQPDGADPLTCAESISCEHASWEDWRECTDACDAVEDVSGCQSACTEERRVNEAFCRDRNVDIEPTYVAYDNCRTEFCDGFWAEFDGLQWEIDCMEENCADAMAACQQN